MKLDKYLDISSYSWSEHHTMSSAARDIPFAVTAIGHFCAGPQYFTNRSERDDYLLLYTISGSGLIRYRGVETELVPGQAILIYCFEPQYYRTGSKGDWTFEYIHCNGSGCELFFRLINEDNFHKSYLSGEEWKAMFGKIRSGCMNTGLREDLILSLGLHELFTSLLFPPKANEELIKHENIIKKVLSYIDEHYKDSLNNRDLCELVHLSEFYFIRIFKAFMGISPYEYLITFRINKAKALLKETERSIESISFDVGFQNVNVFIRAFKKCTGITPNKFRFYNIP
ncbi:MAG: AraC family transcriptional regulator [Bacillota bacterium]|nr:AraC family transcriptional regulator [Bacillota bacterium]